VVVGHGEHDWDVADPTDDRAARPLDWTDSTVRDLLDRPATWAQVVEVVTAAGLTPLGEVQTAARLAAYLEAPVSVVPRVLAPEDIFPTAHDARRQLAAVLGAPATDGTARAI
jgi:hypothetical protein